MPVVDLAEVGAICFSGLLISIYGIPEISHWGGDLSRRKCWSGVSLRIAFLQAGAPSLVPLSTCDSWHRSETNAKARWTIFKEIRVANMVAVWRSD